MSAELNKIHIVPLEHDVAEDARMNEVAPELIKLRTEGSQLASGKTIVTQEKGWFGFVRDKEWIVLECEPSEGKIGMDTEFFTTGPPVKFLSKVWLHAVRQEEAPEDAADSDGLFSNYVKPYLHSLASDGKRTEVLWQTKRITIFNLTFEVVKTEPAGGVGITEANTIIYAEWAPLPPPPPPQAGGYMNDPQLLAAMLLSRQGAGGLQNSEDPELAAAIAASYAPTEDEMLMRAIRESQEAEDRLQRQALRDEQEAELQESILMDQMRAAEAERKRQEQEDAEKALRAEEAEREAQKQREQDEAAALRSCHEADVKAKLARLPAEPPVGDADRFQLVLRLPSGKRLQRAFRSSETVGSIYDFVDVQSLEELYGKEYCLISNMPKTVYEDRSATISGAGIKNQFVLMVELSSV